MHFVELFLIAVSLSMDAFAVSLCKGLNMPRLNWRHGLIIALFFGVFQAFMPLIGWFLAAQFSAFISSFDHWIAFLLLVFVGGQMLFEGLHHAKEEDCGCEEKLDFKELFLLAIATSIDALAVGISFAFLEVKILPSILIIGVTTFVLSLLGVIIGHRFGAKFENKAKIAGGIILILIGIKILLEHLGVLAKLSG
jgi:putative Mn2+ efflux pump MntP